MCGVAVYAAPKVGIAGTRTGGSADEDVPVPQTITKGTGTTRPSI